MPLVSSTNARKPTTAVSGPSPTRAGRGTARGIRCSSRDGPRRWGDETLASVRQCGEQGAMDPLAALEAVDGHALVDTVDGRRLSRGHRERGEAINGGG